MTASPLFGDQNVKPWLEIMGCSLSFPIWNGKFTLKKYTWWKKTFFCLNTAMNHERNIFLQVRSLLKRVNRQKEKCVSLCVKLVRCWEKACWAKLSGLSDCQMLPWFHHWSSLSNFCKKQQQHFGVSFLQSSWGSLGRLINTFVLSLWERAQYDCCRLKEAVLGGGSIQRARLGFGNCVWSAT